MDIKNKKGFTLSETLIAITIIGIIAAVTLPMITYQYKKAVIETKFKKAYSTLSNAIDMSISHNGYPSQWGLGDDNDAWARQYLLPYIKVDNYCEKTQTDICKFSAGYNNSTSKRVKNDIGTSYSRFYMNDGMQVAFRIDKTGSTDGIIFYIDIDGNQNGENKYGKDIFIFNLYTAIYNPGVQNLIKNAPSQMVLIPSGYGRTKANLTNEGTWEACVKGRRGPWCSALIMMNGWKIPKDYPL